MLLQYVHIMPLSVRSSFPRRTLKPAKTPRFDAKPPGIDLPDTSITVPQVLRATDWGRNASTPCTRFGRSVAASPSFLAIGSDCTTAFIASRVLSDFSWSPSQEIRYPQDWLTAVPSLSDTALFLHGEQGPASVLYSYGLDSGGKQWFLRFTVSPADYPNCAFAALAPDGMSAVAVFYQ